MLQNSTPFWTVVSAILIKVSRYNTATWLTMIPVCCGKILTYLWIDVS